MYCLFHVLVEQSYNYLWPAWFDRCFTDRMEFFLEIMYATSQEALIILFSDTCSFCLTSFDRKNAYFPAIIAFKSFAACPKWRVVKFSLSLDGLRYPLQKILEAGNTEVSQCRPLLYKKGIRTIHSYSSTNFSFLGGILNIH